MYCMFSIDVAATMFSSSGRGVHKAVRHAQALMRLLRTRSLEYNRQTEFWCLQCPNLGGSFESATSP